MKKHNIAYKLKNVIIDAIFGGIEFMIFLYNVLTAIVCSIIAGIEKIVAFIINNFNHVHVRIHA